MKWKQYPVKSGPLKEQELHDAYDKIVNQDPIKQWEAWQEMFISGAERIAKLHGMTFDELVEICNNRPTKRHAKKRTRKRGGK